MHANNGATGVTNHHVDVVTVDRAEVSNDRHKVLDVVHESSLSPLATAFMISPVELEVRDATESRTRTESRT